MLIIQNNLIPMGLNLRNALGAMAVAVGVMGGCDVAPDSGEQVAKVQKETTESISDRMADFCRRSPSDVNDLICTLRQDGAEAAILTAGCWSGKGWRSEPEYLAEEYDAVDLDEDCEVNGAQF